ncbi:MAG: hypothetical protein A2Y76_02235 [Planctomycetes bacterium RBG_13_60_9]|nr:MAG: hypothetical protein A2Y76_02235 [Planctomycetes bacterium RBG_13_60_9]
MIGTGGTTGVERRGVYTAVGSWAVLIVLAWSALCGAEILNSGFETTDTSQHYPRAMPVSWGHVDHASFNSYSTNLWCTEGTMSAALLSKIGRTFVAGDFQSFNQSVDLTGIDSITFDVLLAAKPAGLFAHFEASFLVDGVVLWSRSADGPYLDQSVDVSNLSGWHLIEIRNTALEGGSFGTAYWIHWDNLRQVEGPKTIPAVIDLDPDTLGLHGCDKWVICRIELPDGYDVNDIDGATVTLQDIPAYMGREPWAKPAPNKHNIMDRDGDGIRERMVKFDGDAVRAIVQPPEATLAVKGNLTDGAPFEGSATIKVVDRLAELKERGKELKTKIHDAKDKCKDDKDKCKDDKNKCNDKGDKDAKRK